MADAGKGLVISKNVIPIHKSAAGLLMWQQGAEGEVKTQTAETIIGLTLRKIKP